MRMLAFLLALCPTLAFGMDRLSALSMIETGDNDRMVGRAGEISRYQILKSEWRSVTNSASYANAETAKEVALILLARRVKAFEATYHRLPNDFEYYGLWNAPAQVLTGRVSPVVAERCRRYSNLCEWTGVAKPIAKPIAAGPQSAPKVRKQS